MCPESPVRILATDDRPEILRLIERTLGERYECVFANSVEEARERLVAGPFHLALCDIEMPGESGLVLVEEIARDCPETAIVLVTGVDDPGVAEKTFRLGAHGYLVKPFWPGQLLITTMNALRQRELELAQRAHTKAMEERLRLLMETVPVPIFIKDRERRYVLANRVLHEVLGLEPDQLMGLTDKDILPPEIERITAATDRKVLEGGETHEGEQTITLGGMEMTFLAVKFPFRDDSGEIVGVAGMSTDITSKKRAEALTEELAASQARAIEELHASRQETVERLARAIEMRDEETGEHVNRMASIAALLGTELGLDRERVLLLRAAAPMHDVGKIATADEILLKPGALTEAEREEMERHTTVGYEILAGSDSELLRMAATIALSHHERWDGTGYPQGLSGEEIPLEARIVAVADVFDALLSDRCYRPGMPLAKVVTMIREGGGAHFDPRAADALLGNLDEALSCRG
ncbi:MAG TPA: HD domain-containing phosphohydrolase [Solirubrobacterales bacterium]|jgi:putative two-component system response regulator|nr:HD domain-containing phosphohydrolase [Solirubrobacterales bacterium]